MGNTQLSSKSKEPENYDVVNQKTGLSPREVDLVRNTWNMVKADTKGNGVALFIKLFDHHPDYQRMFKAFTNVPKDQLSTNGRLLGHATSVMYALTALVDNLDDPECLVELLTKIAESHKPRNIKMEHFQNLSVVALELLEEKLGNEIMTNATKEAWRKTFNAINSTVKLTIDK